MFNKSVEQLTFEDVQAFLGEGHQESTHLDYKREMIKGEDIAKLAAAFANTEGGFIVFGVREQNGRPVSPFEGEPLGKDPGQTVKQACYDKVRPALSVIVGPLLKNPKDEQKAFLVVAAPQSGKAPHVTATDDRVYIKV